MTPLERMHAIDILLSHVWMVRRFLKNCEEAEDDDELAEIHRTLYDYMLALGGPVADEDPKAYMRMAKKKLRRLREANDLFQEIQPEISNHTNFKMAATSLSESVTQIVALIESAGD